MSAKKSKKEETNFVDNLTGTAREVWLAGLGALASVEEEGSKVFNKLVERGTDFEKRGKEQLDDIYNDVSKAVKDVETKVKSKFNKAEDELEDNVSELVHKLGVPTRDEIKELTSHVEKLAKKVETLSKKVEANADKK